MLILTADGRRRPDQLLKLPSSLSVLFFEPERLVRMRGFVLPFSPLLLFFPILSVSAIDSSSCPFDLSYVTSFPWDSSLCSDGAEGTHCCQTLLSLFGMGLAQHLNDTSFFELSNADSSSSCLSIFQSKLLSMSVPSSVVPLCFPNSAQFVANSSSCAGIRNTRDWLSRVGSNSPLDLSCQGDLTGLTRCGACLDAGMRVNSQLMGIDPNGTKCFYFTILYAAGIVNRFGPMDTRTVSCILGLPLSNSANKAKSNQMDKSTLIKVVLISFSALFCILMAVGFTILYRRRAARWKHNPMHEEYVSSMRTNVVPNSGARWFDITELEKATNGFSQTNLIGQGGYGVVYKGELSNGGLIAVKQVLDLDSKGDEEFSNEVEIISKIRHRNLLSLRGFCVTSDHFKGKRRFLVYDFMPNGNLSDHLYNSCSPKELDWPQRKSIILDVAKGISYLHCSIKPAIYHRDIKATNILLDAQMRAKVADFGLAKQSLVGQSHLTTRVAGTHGYLAPEYALYGQLTEKSDIYSFGIVILEIMSGRKVLDTAHPSVILITDWAWMLLKLGKADEIFHESIREKGAKGVMERFVLVGLLCAHTMVAFRPTIAEALKMLEGDIDIPNLPDRPLPLGDHSFRASSIFATSSTSDSSMLSSRINTVKELSGLP